MEDSMLSTFGDLLKAFRKQRHLTQQELATRIGVHRNTIGMWERGDCLPTSKTIMMELAYQLHLDIHDTRHLLEASLTALSPYWLVPYQRNPFFTGREDMLQYLHDTLTSGCAAVLSGMGGIGKTQTVIEYAYRFANDYSAIFWINAETSGSIVSSLVAITTLLNVLEKQEQEQERVEIAFHRWLTNHSGWLLIFDNVEDLELVGDVLPSARSGSVLFTSQRQSLGLTAQTLHLKRMTVEEGISFLRHRARLLTPPDVVAAREIVEAMDGLPLALDQASIYIERTGCSLTDYRRLFQQHPIRLLQERSVSAGNTHSVIETVLLSFQHLAQVNAAAADLLRVCAFLAPNNIPEVFFVQGASYLGPLLASAISSPYQFNQVLGDVFYYSLLSRQPQTCTLSMHRLVQVVLQESIVEQEQWIWRIIEAMEALFPLSEACTWSDCELLLPHALACIARTASWKQAEFPLTSLLLKIERYLHDRAQYYEEAELLYPQGLWSRGQTLGPGYPKTLKARTNYVHLPEDVRGEGEVECSTLSSSVKRHTSALLNSAEFTVEQCREEYPMCPKCLQTDAVVRSGRNRTGTYRFRCHSCQRYFTPVAHQRGYAPSLRSLALTLVQNGMSARAIAQRLSVHHSTISLWIKENQMRQEESSHIPRTQ
jgi:transposase-like protein/transcriptional regulator with XRE-family HTH domain